jgi:hypothetical protein
MVAQRSLAPTTRSILELDPIGLAMDPVTTIMDLLSPKLEVDMRSRR